MPTNYAAIPAPADATEIDEWDRVFDVDVLHRFFLGTQRGDVGISGYQNGDGSVRERFIHVSRGLDDGELDAAAARVLARALIAAADELDSLSDPPATISE